MKIRSALRVLLLAGGLLLGGTASAQSVSLAGMLGGKALLVVNGGAPKAVAVGESHQGVKVLQTQGEQAVVDISGVRQTLRMGDVPVNAGGGAPGPSSSGRVVLQAGSGGHFSSQGLINGRPVTLLVDTGATSVAISSSDADRIGLNYKSGKQVRVTTANGNAVGWLVKLNSVRLGDAEVYGVDAIVTPTEMPFVLLGNSFLSRFQMNRDNDQLILVKRF
jgi:aspartyl protease family protein